MRSTTPKSSARFTASLSLAIGSLTIGVLAVGVLAVGSLAIGAAAPVRAAPAGASDAAALYATHCAECHGARRYGGYAPPLLADTLERKSDDVLVAAILDGLPNTQMPAFGEKLGAADAQALVQAFRQPTAAVTWSLEDIRASRVELESGAGRIPAEVRRENLILVVERGSGDVVVVDGDTLTELDRFEVGRIHGGVKFDRRLRSALAATRDGTVVDYDLVSGAARTRVKAGVNTRNIAVSSDGAFVAAANQLPQSLVVFDGRLRPLKVFALPGQPSAVYQLPAASDGVREFVLTLRDLPRLYRVSLPELTLHEATLSQPFEDFVFVPGKPQLIASARGGSQLLLYDYRENRVLGSLETQGLPHLFSASFFERGGRLHAAFNHMGVPRLSLIDMADFQVVAEVPLLGPGYFTRTHEGTPYLWIDTNTEAIQLVEKESFELLPQTLVPESGKKAMHVEFTAEGDKALVSIWHSDGAVVVYDSNTLKELERIPYRMPVGKYNAANKTRVLHQ